jgi:hypothetical protein
MSGLGWLSAKCALKKPLLAGAALLVLVTTGGSQALASAGCDAVNAGAFNLHFTQPNSAGINIAGFAIGDKITFKLTGAEPSGGANAFVVAEPNNTVLLNVSDIMSPRSVSIPVSAVTGTTLQALPQTRGKATLGVTAACTPASSGGAGNTDGSGCTPCRSQAGGETLSTRPARFAETPPTLPAVPPKPPAAMPEWGWRPLQN